MSLQPYYIAGSSVGFETDKKPFLLPDQAFTALENAYVWRDRVIKREGNRLLGRLRREFEEVSFFDTGASPWTFNILVVSGYISNITAPSANGVVTTTYPHNLVTGDMIVISGVVGTVEVNGGTFTITVLTPTTFQLNFVTVNPYVSGGFWISNRSLSSTEPNAEIEPGSVVITIQAGPDIVFTDQGDGTLTSPTLGNSGTINYLTGTVILTHTAGAGVATVITYAYFPSLPVMGIYQIEQGNINEEQTIWFDTKYAYKFLGVFMEFIPGTTWDGTDADFFWGTNYRSSSASDRIFFVTNFVNSAVVPMRFTDGSTWTSFTPQLNNTGTLLLQARILIPYYGRLLALNTFEGNALGAGNNFYNRCRFSQIGNPLEAYNFATKTGAWAEDIFGKGGFIDAPTSEQIIGAAFIKNTLIVFFERSTWQLRYVGEYGLPFLWERISADLGSESTFSTVIFDKGALAVGQTGIIAADAVQVNRIDEKIPDLVFNIRNAQSGTKRVVGIRDYQRELVFWTFPNADIPEENVKFPNNVLVYNYRNATFAVFRDNVTFFGYFQPPAAITWSSLDVFWEDEKVTWSGVDQSALFPFIIAGNQQGFVHYYGYVTPDEESLSITDIDLTASPIELTIINHNLDTGDIVYLTDLQFVDSVTLQPIATDLNDQIYRITRIDTDTVSLSEWDFTAEEYIDDFSFTPVAATSVYIGKGRLALFPKLNVITKDFNPYQDKGGQLKLSYIDFLTDVPVTQPNEIAAMTVIILLNTSPAAEGNLLVGNRNVETDLPTPFYVPASDYVWHRFYATVAGQFIRVIMTYDDNLMNRLNTHRQDWTLNALTLWVRPGGKVIF